MRIGDFKGRWVLVTGAASGIGRATALAFAGRGGSLVICDTDELRLDGVRTEIAALGVPCIAETVDVSDEAAMRAFAERTHAAVPALDVLVNNAGIGYLGPFEGSPLEVWRRVLGINVMGVVHGCQLFLPRMRAAGGTRRIVNVASLAGLAPAPNMSAYAASKSAVVGLSEALALELRLDGSGVGITTVCPGIIDTGITEAPGNVSPAMAAGKLAALRSYYAKHGARPEVVAEAIVDAVDRRRELVLVGPFARPIYHLRRLSRRLARALMLKDAKKAGYA